nr:reverse transcriptase domain-containing protein [Tanacetum cinerariifolium]
MRTREHEKRHRSRHSRSPRPSPSVFSRIKRDRSRSPRQNSREKEGGVFKRLGNRENSVSARSDSRNQRSYSRYTGALLESEDSGGNARVWFDDIPAQSIDSYDYLKKAILENYLQQKKCIKDPIEIHNIKQRDGESTEDFVKRNQLVPTINLLIGFSGEIIWPIGKIQLLANSQKAASSFVKSSLNAKTPGRRRSHYSKEKHDDPTRMCDGLQIRREPSNYQANSRKKNQAQPGYFCLEARGYDRRSKTYCETSLECAEGCSSVIQKKRRQAADRNQAIQEEVEKLVEAGIIKEMHTGATIKSKWKKKMKKKRSLQAKEYSAIQRCLRSEKLQSDLPASGGQSISQAYWQKPRRRTEVKWKTRKLEQTAEAEEAFKQMKQLIAKLPMLVVLMKKEELIIYLAAAKVTVSAVLMTEREAKQMPIYFVNKALRGLKLTNPEGMKFTYALRFRFDATKNKAEYKALIAGLRIAKRMGVKNLQANVDSQLVANQVNGTYVTKEADMIRYLEKHFTSIKHLQTNGLVERANQSLGEGIKARLDTRSKNWMEELPHVLWAYRTMIKSSNRDTLFSLTYGTEAVIPAEIGMPTLRTMEVDLVQNNEALKINLDLLKEKREQAAIREAKSKAKMEKYYNSKVRSASFKPGDLVYRNNDASRVKDIGKLGPKWEGRYEVTKALGKGAYKLRDRDGKQLPRTWNVCNLKKCYIHKM